MSSTDNKRWMGDKPGDAARNAAIEHATVSATAVVVGVVTGNPLAGLAAAVAAKGGVAWFRSLAEGPNRAFQDVRFTELENAFAKLDERVRRLEAEAAGAGQPEERSATARNEVYSTFAAEVARAQTEVRCEALINAAARQFDAREGNQAVRKLWFERVAALNDIEAWVIGKLAESEHAFLAGPGTVVRVEGGNASIEDSLPDSERIAFGTTLEALARDQQWAKATGRTITGERETVNVISLTHAGRILARFMSEPK